MHSIFYNDFRCLSGGILYGTTFNHLPELRIHHFRDIHCSNIKFDKSYGDFYFVLFFNFLKGSMIGLANFSLNVSRIVEKHCYKAIILVIYYPSLSIKRNAMCNEKNIGVIN